MEKETNKKAETQARYMEKKKMIAFILDKEKDAEIIGWLERQENQSEAIREALKEMRL